MEVKVDIKYACGCGFKTNKESEAITHTEYTGHTITVLGIVRKED